MYFRALIWCLTFAGVVVICLYGVEDSDILVSELTDVFLGLISRNLLKLYSYRLYYNYFNFTNKLMNENKEFLKIKNHNFHMSSKILSFMCSHRSLFWRGISNCHPKSKNTLISLFAVTYHCDIFFCLLPIFNLKERNIVLILGWLFVIRNF